MLTEFLMNRTLPSHMPTLVPPGCLLRVLVTMDMPIGSAFGFFSIPLNGAAAADKPASTKDEPRKFE